MFAVLLAATEAPVEDAVAATVVVEPLLKLVVFVILGLLSMLAIMEPSRSTGETLLVLDEALLPAKMILCEGKVNVL